MSRVLRFLQAVLLTLLVCGFSACIGSGDPEDPGDADVGLDGGADGGADGGDDEGSDGGDDGGSDGGDDGDADGGDDGGDEGGDQTGEPPELTGILDAHNAAREAEGAGLPPLTWDPLLAAIAEEWAQQCVSENGSMLAHNQGRSDTYDGPVGENIAASRGDTLTGPVAVQLWMDEKPFYNHATGACSGTSCGHYTQVVWRDTLRVGCASVFCERLRFPRNVVCNYAPAGNVFGQRPY